MKLVAPSPIVFCWCLTKNNKHNHCVWDNLVKKFSYNSIFQNLDGGVGTQRLNFNGLGYSVWPWGVTLSSGNCAELSGFCFDFPNRKHSLRDSKLFFWLFFPTFHFSVNILKDFYTKTIYCVGQLSHKNKMPDQK